MFKLGQVVMTAGVNDFANKDGHRLYELSGLVLKHESGDWGEVPPEDAESNDYALKNGERILSSYTLHGEKIWIITEWDRSVTTILLPNEY